MDPMLCQRLLLVIRVACFYLFVSYSRKKKKKHLKFLSLLCGIPKGQVAVLFKYNLIEKGQ